MTAWSASRAATADARRASARVVWVVAVGLAVLGVVLNVARPLAPALPSTPVEQEQFSGAVLAAVEAYRSPRLVGALGLLAIDVVIPIVLAVYAPAWLRRLAGEHLRHGALRGALIGVVVVGLTRAVAAPLRFWLGHVDAQEWGFRTGSAVGWWRDWALGMVLDGLVVGVAVGLLVVLIRRAGRSWPAWMALAGTVLTAGLVLVQPLVVEPLFLPTRPLEDGPMRDRLQDVLSAADMEADLLVGDASQRTTSVNAHVAGIGPTRRVVLWDTLLELPPDEVAAVVAHELAHRDHGDILRGVMLSASGLLAAGVWLRWLLERPVVRDRVRARDDADPRLVPVLVAGVALAITATLPVANAVSRRAEAAADARALAITGDPGALVATFRVFVVQDLAYPAPPMVRTWFFGTHPPPDERIRATVAEAQRRGLAVPSLDTLRADEQPLVHPRAR